MGDCTQSQEDIISLVACFHPLFIFQFFLWQEETITEANDEVVNDLSEKVAALQRFRWLPLATCLFSSLCGQWVLRNDLHGRSGRSQLDSIVILAPLVNVTPFIKKCSLFHFLVLFDRENHFLVLFDREKKKRGLVWRGYDTCGMFC